MKKPLAVGIVVAVVAAAYLIILVLMPILTGIVATSNTTMQATANMSQFPGAAEAIVSTPWILFFVPGVIGMAIIVLILKHK